MKKLILFFGIAGLLAFAACDPSVETTDTQTTNVDSNARIRMSDMSPYCWFNENTLQREVYHTAPWASKIDSSWQDSYGFRGYFKDFGDGMPTQVDVSFWTLFPKLGLDAKMVIGIDSVETQVFWAGFDIKDSIKSANEWQQIHITLGTPAKIDPEDRLTVYIWSYDKSELYIDDLEVKFIY